jgi:hypothetical protein
MITAAALAVGALVLTLSAGSPATTHQADTGWNFATTSTSDMPADTGWNMTASPDPTSSSDPTTPVTALDTGWN